MSNNTNAPTEWVTVPRVATEAMLDASDPGCHQGRAYLNTVKSRARQMRAHEWSRMIETAPPAPEAAPSHDAYVLQLLIAGGHVTSHQVEQARGIAARVCPATEAGARRPLTDEQMEQIASAVRPIAETGEPSWEHAVGRAVESAHGIGGPAQVEQPERKGVEWRPIETAPRDGSPIVGWCVHAADIYYEEAGNRLTDYGARVEGLSHVEDGAHVIAWEDAREESDGWEHPSYTIPGGWVLTNGDGETMANPTHWHPLPAPPTQAQPAPPAGINTTEGE